jgi:hypothetical protein
MKDQSYIDPVEMKKEPFSVGNGDMYKNHFREVDPREWEKLKMFTNNLISIIPY